MGDTYTGWAASVEWVDPRRRVWMIRPYWTGWRRVIGFGLVFNLATPAVTLWIIGWQIIAGRFPEKMVVPVEQWNLGKCCMGVDLGQPGQDRSVRSVVKIGK